MGPNHTNTPNGSWMDKFEINNEQHSSWLDLYRRHLSWIKSSGNDNDETLLNDLASDL